MKCLDFHNGYLLLQGLRDALTTDRPTEQHTKSSFPSPFPPLPRPTMLDMLVKLYARRRFWTEGFDCNHATLHPFSGETENSLKTCQSENRFIVLL